MLPFYLKENLFVGKTFNWLTIKSVYFKKPHSMASCECICGKKVNYTLASIVNGRRKSCGCKRKGINSGEKNGNWKKNVKVAGLHVWIKSHFPKPTVCSICKKNPPKDLANISPKYNPKTYTRDFNNWEWLCRRCHMEKDGRMKKFVENFAIKRKNKKCVICGKEFRPNRNSQQSCSRLCGSQVRLAVKHFEQR